MADENVHCVSGRNAHVGSAGALRVAQRRDDYSDRRTDGYSEPLEVYVLGTSHASEASAADVRRVVGAVRPQSVVVEVGFSSCFNKLFLRVTVFLESWRRSRQYLQLSTWKVLHRSTIIWEKKTS